MVGFLIAVHSCSQAAKKGIKWPVLHKGAALVACGTDVKESNEVFSE
jgi:hypothetical protein